MPVHARLDASTGGSLALMMHRSWCLHFRTHGSTSKSARLHKSTSNSGNGRRSMFPVVFSGLIGVWFARFGFVRNRNRLHGSNGLFVTYLVTTTVPSHHAFQHFPTYVAIINAVCTPDSIILESLVWNCVKDVHTARRCFLITIRAFATNCEIRFLRNTAVVFAYLKLSNSTICPIRVRNASTCHHSL